MMCTSRKGHVYQPGVLYALDGRPEKEHNLDMCVHCGAVHSDKGTIPLTRWMAEMNANRDPKRHLVFLGGNEELITGVGGGRLFDRRLTRAGGAVAPLITQAPATA